jgi:NADH-quinone oxidoreductase subunit G
MSKQDEQTVEIEVDGVPLKARRGEMLIEVTDRHEVYVPRFCYHHKLSVAANCRMCLVDVEKAPKPLPACATPVTDGMKVFTRSERAISAQKATMEFLLINHPLDCPICDQGGECELQDLAMGFGRGVSRYTERKRVVKDKNLGPLVSTDMTRCIHCTRCIRFGQEIAGIQELGAVGRSEDMEIGTYVEKSVDHELSGNIIDLCPVGALNNKPFRFGARAWEMVSRSLVSPHDCVGSNLYGHVLRGRLRRIVPRDNEEINEAWISDRDRFSCHGIDSDDRLEQPMLKTNGQWATVSWDMALDAVQEALESHIADEGDALGILVSPSATLEEMHMLRRLADHLGSRNIDYRLRRRDFADQDDDPLWPSLGCTIPELGEQEGLLFIGSNLRSEVPIIAHRVRRAVLEAGTAVGFVNPSKYEYYFPVTAYTPAPMDTFAASLGGVVAAAAEATGKPLPEHVAGALEGITIEDSHRAAVAVLLGKSRSLVLLGQIAQRHPAFASIRALARALCQLMGASLGYLSEGANAAGASLVGCLPHRDAGGAATEARGFDAASMLASPRRVYVLFGVEPDADLAHPGLAHQALTSADKVICFTPYTSESLSQCADILLPIGTFAETPGTFINAEGRVQSFPQAADPKFEARPGWRVLRVLGNKLGIESFQYHVSEDVRGEALAAAGTISIDAQQHEGGFRPTLEAVETDPAALDVNMYQIDAIVRRSLNSTRFGSVYPSSCGL